MVSLQKSTLVLFPAVTILKHIMQQGGFERQLDLNLYDGYVN